MAQELLGRVPPATQELLGHDIDLRALRTYETKDRGARGTKSSQGVRNSGRGAQNHSFRHKSENHLPSNIALSTASIASIFVHIEKRAHLQLELQRLPALAHLQFVG